MVRLVLGLGLEWSAFSLTVLMKPSGFLPQCPKQARIRTERERAAHPSSAMREGGREGGNGGAVLMCSTCIVLSSTFSLVKCSRMSMCFLF